MGTEGAHGIGHISVSYCSAALRNKPPPNSAGSPASLRAWHRVCGGGAGWGAGVPSWWHGRRVGDTAPPHCLWSSAPHVLILGPRGERRQPPPPSKGFSCEGQSTDKVS